MDTPPARSLPVDLDELRTILQRTGARFAYLFGSWAEGTAETGSDIDVAAWFGRDDVDPIAVAGRLPGQVDLLVLDHAPLELSGRVALQGSLFLDDPPTRVHWEATTRKLYADEEPRRRRARLDFATARRGRS